MVRPGRSRLPGGCDFAANPAIADQPIFWTEAASPAVLRFSAAPAEQVRRSSPDDPLLNGATVRPAHDGLHAVWRLGAHQLQARLDGAGDWRDAAVILPLDDALDLRALTAMRLARWLRRKTAGPDPAPLSAARRTRLVQVLRALDARADGASLRDIAEGLFGHRLSGRAWQDSDLQARTRRLVRSGVALTHGGYREVLNPLARARRRRLRQSPRDEGAPP